MAETISKIVDAESLLADQSAEIKASLEDLLTAIRAVPDETQRAVLTMRYVEGLDWLSIAERIGYEHTQTYVIHARALLVVNEWLKKKEHLISVRSVRPYKARSESEIKRSF